MKRIYFFLVIFVLTATNFAHSVLAQEWSNEQKDVWSGVEKYWAAAASGDAQAFLAYFDESYKGWDNQSPVPESKANTSKWVEYGSKNHKVLVYTITPLAIWVKGEFAYVHYSYAEVDKNTETGKTSNNMGTWTDILMKKEGKWLLIGDHGGRTSKEN